MSAEDQREAPDANNENTNGFSRSNGEDRPKTEEEYAEAQLTLRAIVTSREAGVIIGKAGKNVAELRDETGVRAGVSKAVPGVHDRILAVTGALAGISKAYGIVSMRSPGSRAIFGGLFLTIEVPWVNRVTFYW